MDVHSELEQRVIGAYLGLAVGDALGATVEFMTPAEIRTNYGVHNRIRGGGWLKLKAGQVTDDTTMSLALGAAILAEKSIESKSIAQAFSDWMSAKPVDIGNTVRRGIIHYRHSGIPQVPENEHDAGNGACMRILPVALATFGLPHEQIQSAARAQAHVTHNNPLSDAAADCIVALVHGALNDVSKQALFQHPINRLIQYFPEFDYSGRCIENPTGYIVDTMQAVFQALSATNDFKSCLIDVVNRGGDADTTGAIAGMIAGSLYGVEAIPEAWLNHIDPRIKHECEQQAVALLYLSDQINMRKNTTTTMAVTL
jgi:ADP-ribosyl-[dinitrogen reductase] hydrolase